MVKVGDNVLILSNWETECWQIAGKQGYIATIDILGNLYIRISGYPMSFVLQLEEVELCSDQVTGSSTASEIDQCC